MIASLTGNKMLILEQVLLLRRGEIVFSFQIVSLAHYFPYLMLAEFLYHF